MWEELCWSFGGNSCGRGGGGLLVAPDETAEALGDGYRGAVMTWSLVTSSRLEVSCVDMAGYGQLDII